MQCYKCGHDTHVLETRGVRRRRECMSCKERFTTLEQLLPVVEEAPKEFKPRVLRVPNPSRAKEKLIAQKKARDAIESRRWEKENDWYSEDNNYLPDKY